MARSTLLILLLVAVLGHDVCRSQEEEEDSSLSSLSELPSDESEEESGEVLPTFYFNLSNSNFENFKQVLAPQFARANVASDQQFQISLDITPPANSGSEFVTELQNVIKELASKYAPLASTAIKIAVTKTSSGILTNLKVDITLTPPKVATLPRSTLPEIDLRKHSDYLPSVLRDLVSREIWKQGYDFDSDKTQNYTLEFNVLPPEGATKDYVKENVVKPLQKTVRSLLPTGSVTSISVNTLESNGKLLRQTVKAQVRVKPVIQPRFSENVEEVPEIDLNRAGNINLTLQEIIDEGSKNDKTIAIPIKVNATDAELEENIEYIEAILKELDPSTRIEKVTKETLRNGDKVFTVYVDFDEESGKAGTTARATSTTTTTRSTSTTTSKPSTTKATSTTTTTRPSTSTRTTTTTTKATPTATRKVTTTRTTTAERITPQDRSLNVVTEKPKTLPKDAIQTSVVDFSTSKADPSKIFNVIEDALSNSSIAEDGSVTLAIPFKFPPISGEGSPEEQEIVEEIDKDLESLLKRIEPSGEVVDSIGQDLADAYETIVYFRIPTLENSPIYEVLQKKNLAKPTGKIVEAPVISLLNTVISPDMVQEEIEDDLDETLVPNLADDKGGITIGFPVKIPSDVADLVPNYANAVANILKKLEPSGVLLPNLVTKPLNNSVVQFEIYYRIPKINDTNTYKENKKNKDFVFDNDKGQTYINGSPIDNNNSTVDFIVPNENNKNVKNAISVPKIDLNNGELLDNIKTNLGKTLENHKKFERDQQFNFEFKLNPNDFQGSIQKIAKALETLDPKGRVDSYKVKSGSDGSTYLDLGFLVPNFKHSSIYKLRNFIEIIDIDAKKPYHELLEKVITVTGDAIKDVEGVKKGARIDLNFGFKLVDSEGMSDREVSNLIKKLVPRLKETILEVLPDSKIASWKTISHPNSDDVILRFSVKTRYEPDDVIVIKNIVRKKTTTTTTTTTKRPKHRFLWF